MAIAVPIEFGYVAIVVVCTFVVNMFFQMKVGAARKKYNVPYPTLYATESDNKEAKVFNCIQRGHQNFLENVPFFFTLLIFAGLQHPIAAAIAGILFLVGRVIYFSGYSTGIPKSRMPGMGVSMIGLLTLLGCSISFAVHSLL